jgi:hypothetical protein
MTCPKCGKDDPDCVAPVFGGDDEWECGACGYKWDERNRPLVKVTETTGFLSCHRSHISIERDESYSVMIGGLLPRELFDADGLPKDGMRGKFRFTCEWWPLPDDEGTPT